MSTAARRVVANIAGDIVVGALFPMHEAPDPDKAHRRMCGKIREQYGIQRVEAAFLTIDQINSDDTILPNITLGLEVRDGCWYSPIALEQSIEFIRDAMAAKEEKAARTAAGTALAADRNRISSELFPDSPDDQTSGLLSGSSPLFHLLKTPLSISHQLNASSFTCPATGTVRKKSKNIVGVIGPAGSADSVAVQNLLQLFNMPQIGYSATTRDLSQKNFYNYFLRVVPSDKFQAQVLVDIMRSYNWTYVSTVHTIGTYGSTLFEEFKIVAQSAGICIANINPTTNDVDDDVAFDRVLNYLLKHKDTARIVICFCEGDTARGLLKAIKRNNAAGHLVLVGSDGWADRRDVIKDYEREAIGSITVRINSPYIHSFDDYYFSLHPHNNSRNPWFREFWEQRFNCILPPPGTSISLTDASSSFPATRRRYCTGQESLQEDYKQDTKLAFVMKSIWTMAHGLHNMQRDLCPKSSGLCHAMLPVNGSLLMQYLMNVTFQSGNETISFDENGDPPGKYDIMNFQQTSEFDFKYVHVGSWSSHIPTSAEADFRKPKLKTFRPLRWPQASFSSSSNSSLLSVPESVCSKPCAKGEKKVAPEGAQADARCCWACFPCHEFQYLEDDFTCKDCPLGWWPHEDLVSGEFFARPYFIEALSFCVET